MTSPILTPVTQGEGFTLKSPSGSIPLTTFKSKVYPSAFVGVYIDVPIDSSSSKLRHAVGAYGKYAVNRMVDTAFKANTYGEFGYQGRKDGIDKVWCHRILDDKGVPAFIRIQFTVKPHRLGSVLALVLGHSIFKPPRADLSFPILIPFKRDYGHLLYAAKIWEDILMKSISVAVVTGKEKNLKTNFVEKFNKAIPKKKRDVNYKGSTSITESSDIEIVYGCSMKKYSISGLTSDFSKALVLQVISRRGHLYVKGNDLYVNVKKDTDDIKMKMAERLWKKVLKSGGKVGMMINTFNRLAKTDRVSDNSVSTILAISSLMCGMSITDVKTIQKGGITYSKDNSKTIERVSKEVLTLFA